MKKAVLGMLLTAAAGLAGAMAGLLLFAIPLGLGVFLFPASHAPGVSHAVGVLAWAAPALGAVVGIALGWRALMREPRHEAERERRRTLCRRCQYDLHHNTTGRCPECGKPIPLKQQRYLREQSAPHLPQ